MGPLVAAAIPAVIELVKEAIDRTVPNKAQAEKAKAEAERLIVDGGLQRDLAQIDVNRIEASSSDRFVAGWRPFIGWTCGVGVGWNLLLQPLLEWVSGMFAIPAPPLADGELLLTLTGILLGVAGLRTFEKLKGVAR